MQDRGSGHFHYRKELSLSMTDCFFLEPGRENVYNYIKTKAKRRIFSMKDSNCAYCMGGELRTNSVSRSVIWM